MANANRQNPKGDCEQIRSGPVDRLLSHISDEHCEACREYLTRFCLLSRLRLYLRKSRN